MNPPTPLTDALLLKNHLADALPISIKHARLADHAAAMESLASQLREALEAEEEMILKLDSLDPLTEEETECVRSKRKAALERAKAMGLESKPGSEDSPLPREPIIDSKS